MADLNQYAISKVLGSTMKPLGAAGFGNFHLLGAVAGTLRVRETKPLETGFHFGYEHDRVIARAFEDVRDGAAPDAILWNRDLSRAFDERCRQLGIDAPDALLNRRLLNIRKNKKRYERRGIVLSPTTRSEPQPSIVDQYAHVIEFALVKLRYRFGSSIDDILLDPALSEQYEKLAQTIAPELDPVSLRLAALNIRKSRFIQKAQRKKIEALDIDRMERTWSDPVPLTEIRPENIPPAPGILELREGSRFLYIARNKSLQPAIKQLATGCPFKVMESTFWIPDLKAITLQFVVGNDVAGTNVGKWEKRLISDREPIFNWPMHKAAA